MTKFDKIINEVHDKKILRIQHLTESPNITFIIEGDRKFHCNNVAIFRSESYFGPHGLSSDGLYIDMMEIHENGNDWLIVQANDQIGQNGEKKWGDKDKEVFHLREMPLIHIYIYCIDWEFDIACESCELI